MSKTKAYTTRESLNRVLESYGKAQAAKRQYSLIQSSKIYNIRPREPELYSNVPKWIKKLAELIQVDAAELEVLLTREDGVFTPMAVGYFKEFVMAAKLSSTGNHLNELQRHSRKKLQTYRDAISEWEAKHANKLNESAKLTQTEQENRARVVARWNTLLDSLELAVEVAKGDLRVMAPNDQMAVKVLSERKLVQRVGPHVQVMFGVLRNMDSDDIVSIVRNLHSKIVKLENDSQTVVFRDTAGNAA